MCAIHQEVPCDSKVISWLSIEHTKHVNCNFIVCMIAIRRKLSSKLTCIMESSAGKCVRRSQMPLMAFLHFVCKSSLLVLEMKPFTNAGSTSFSATAFAWLGECRPIWPSDQALALLIWSSTSVTSASKSGGIPSEAITVRASVSEKAAM